MSKTYVLDTSVLIQSPTALGCFEDNTIILLGDPNQIDHPLLDERTNGLSYASERMRGSALCFQVAMKPEECERSVLSGDASGRM